MKDVTMFFIFSTGDITASKMGVGGHYFEHFPPLISRHGQNMKQQYP